MHVTLMTPCYTDAAFVPRGRVSPSLSSYRYYRPSEDYSPALNTCSDLKAENVLRTADGRWVLAGEQEGQG